MSRAFWAHDAFAGVDRVPDGPGRLCVDAPQAGDAELMAQVYVGSPWIGDAEARGRRVSRLRAPPPSSSAAVCRSAAAAACSASSTRTLRAAVVTRRLFYFNVVPLPEDVLLLLVGHRDPGVLPSLPRQAFRVRAVRDLGDGVRRRLFHRAGLHTPAGFVRRALLPEISTR
jgi:hypothetical protein